jgi:hypothetical protein
MTNVLFFHRLKYKSSYNMIAYDASFDLYINYMFIIDLDIYIYIYAKYIYIYAKYISSQHKSFYHNLKLLSFYDS